MVSTSSLKNLEKTERFYLYSFRTFVIDFEVTAKPFSRMLPLSKTWFEQSLTLCLTFSENAFSFVTQKFAKKCKVLFQKTQNIYF